MHMRYPKDINGLTWFYQAVIADLGNFTKHR
jgi:hypothetical protein